ncbi:penicillin-binding protein 1A [Treponema primitia ZAS-2]|uniref:peptidoglycan glycosyltransferase n=1 Tax=Treponema primitia (strain ATCC BAA-887 / DSM 12427 / ZAS-2) TaxID=545694 RepID=F5YNV4_TREPZ|nr:PBP1A family penicillin-binding protein [Treponema primitia]AEF84147.1 penicillin-binding protein 1A [Treponema primitia ZAS-2]
MKGSVLIRIFAAITVLVAVIIGVGLGLSLAETNNIKNQENFIEFAPALPTKIVDINGTLITEFSADEKREMVSLNELPRHLIYAVLAREDPDFYNHKGFSIRGISRAALGKLIGKSLGGGSTITQQVAGTLYTDRTEYSYSRKIRELWWSFQMERRYTKNEILEIYLNYMYMGPGTYGVEAASKYFFGHSAREITLAEAAILAVQLSSPSRYNPLDNPNIARDRQRSVLDRMIEFGYTTPAEAEASFAAYWDNYDYTRASTSAYYNREDAAPWFSEYVRRELDSMMYGTMDYYRDGFTVLTTLDLNHQQAAAKFMEQGLDKANKEYTRSSGNRLTEAERTYVPVIDMLSLFFDLSDIHASSEAQGKQKAFSRYTKTINPVVDMASLIFGIQDLKVITGSAFADLKTSTEKNVVEGALVSIENETGYITALIGGSKYDESNQLIRATQGNIQPGSSFKPLYYSAAIDSRIFTPTSMIYDLPIVFHNEDGTPYIPLNFRGEWKGTVLLYDALANSMNVPSLKVLDAIGFDAAIDRAATLLGITDPATIRRTFPRVYPLGLGIISAAPLQMARAFAVFANQGRDVSPIAIRAVEDRNGRVVLDTEREVRLRQRRLGSDIQVISPQNAYVMTSMLKKTVEMGTLYNPSEWGAKFTFRDEQGNRFRMPMAGKTGTPQNWSDAWTVGYSPYYTTAIWFGFDKPGNSLGVNLTGSTLAGPVWADFMREIHQGLPFKDFVKPSTGIVDVTVCTKSGLLKTPNCPADVTMPFLEGTQPTRYCDMHNGAGNNSSPLYQEMRFDTMLIDSNSLLGEIKMPELRMDLLPPELQRPAAPNRNAPRPGTRTSGNTSQGTANSTTTRTARGTSSQEAPSPGRSTGTSPAASQTPSRNTRGNPVIPDDEFALELPSYNPLLD